MRGQHIQYSIVDTSWRRSCLALGGLVLTSLGARSSIPNVVVLRMGRIVRSSCSTVGFGSSAAYLHCDTISCITWGYWVADFCHSPDHSSVQQIDRSCKVRAILPSGLATSGGRGGALGVPLAYRCPPAIPRAGSVRCLTQRVYLRLCALRTSLWAAVVHTWYWSQSWFHPLALRISNRFKINYFCLLSRRRALSLHLPGLSGEFDQAHGGV